MVGSPWLPMRDRWSRKSHASTARQDQRDEGRAAAYAGVHGNLGQDCWGASAVDAASSQDPVGLGLDTG